MKYSTEENGEIVGRKGSDVRRAGWLLALTEEEAVGIRCSQ